MSSDDDDSAEESYETRLRVLNGGNGSRDGRYSKKRRGRACDLCRRKKIKCDGTEDVDRSCTNCIASKSKCTYVEPAKERLPIEYINELKSRLNKLEAILSEFFPLANVQDKQLSAESLRRTLLPVLPSVPGTFFSPSYPKDNPEPSNSQSQSQSQSLDPRTSAIEGACPSVRVPSDTRAHGRHGQRQPRLRTQRFLGQSSPAALLLDALNIKLAADAARAFHAHPCQHDDETQNPGKERARLPPLLAARYPDDIAAIAEAYFVDPNSRPPAFHSPVPGPFFLVPPRSPSASASAPLPFVFPPSDLADALVRLFFESVHWYLPVLHMPTFLAQYHGGMHLRVGEHRNGGGDGSDGGADEDGDFAAVMLLVCAVAARYSDDVRVLPVNTSSTSHPRQQERGDPRQEDDDRWLYAGLDYYAQVLPLVGRPSLRSPTLYDLQKTVLACLYIHGSKSAAHAWSLSGLGIRLALEAGAHRSQLGDADAALAVESQMWKRAFWALVALDRLGSASTGRPCAIQDEDIDVDFPIGVDDEYWESGKPADSMSSDRGAPSWKQPTNKPARAECFRAMLKLLEILAFTLRTVYSTNKSRYMLGLVGPNWQQRVVSEIDSALNKWMELLPDHLRWDPQQPDKLFLGQSALLHCTYYQVQTLVHRPFISQKCSPTNDGIGMTPAAALSFASLAACTNAARAISRILDVHLARGDASPFIGRPAFVSGIVLLMHVWSMSRRQDGLVCGVADGRGESDRGGGREARERCMRDVGKCMEWLKAHSTRWVSARFAWDVLRDLSHVSDLPQPQLRPDPPIMSGTKRPRQASSLAGAAGPSGAHGGAESASGRVPLPGTRKISAHAPSTSQGMGMGRVFGTQAPWRWTTSEAQSRGYWPSTGMGPSSGTDGAQTELSLQFAPTVSNMSVLRAPGFNYPVCTGTVEQTGQDGLVTEPSMFADDGVEGMTMAKMMPTDGGLIPYTWVDDMRIVVPSGAAVETSQQYIALGLGCFGGGEPVSDPSRQQHVQRVKNEDNPGAEAVQRTPLYPEPEAFMTQSQEALDMWSTVPTSFETRDWDAFVQEFQIEDQLRSSDFFLDVTL